MTDSIKKFFSGFKRSDVIWFSVSTAVILALNIYYGDSPVEIISALTGIWCVFLCGNGKLACFIVGSINVLAYSYVAFHAHYYGDMLLNLLYYLPSNVVGFILWSRNKNSESGEVVGKRMSGKAIAITVPLAAAAVAVYGFILGKKGGSLPYADSARTVFSITAQILLLKRYSEQWLLCIIGYGIAVGMWIYAFVSGSGTPAMLVMWIVNLINAVSAFIKWNRKISSDEKTK